MVTEFYSPHYDIDYYYDNVVLSLQFTGNNNSTNIIDYSKNTKTINVINNTHISTNITDAFNNNTGVFYFNCSNNNFTIEFWIYRSNLIPNGSRIYNPDGDYYNGIILLIDNNGYLLS